MTDPDATSDVIRRFLLGLLLLGLLGTTVELLLLAHYEEMSQWIPIALVLLALLSLGWHTLLGSIASLYAVRMTMCCWSSPGSWESYCTIEAAWNFRWRSTRRSAAAEDPDFTGEGDRVRYVIETPGLEGSVEIDVKLWYQPISFRWADNLRSYKASEIRRFVSYYDAMAASSAEILAQQTTIVR